jgi:hypothetical protein
MYYPEHCIYMKSDSYIWRHFRISITSSLKSFQNKDLKVLTKGFRMLFISLVLAQPADAWDLRIIRKIKDINGLVLWSSFLKVNKIKVAELALTRNILFFFFSSTRGWTQGFMLATWATPPARNISKPIYLARVLLLPLGSEEILAYLTLLRVTDDFEHLRQDWQTFSVKDWSVNTSDALGHWVSVATTQVSHC